tara:strand:+ start:143 stop:316 length:174 start_codon:yes stop_codon:yes gene_type:complete
MIIDIKTKIEQLKAERRTLERMIKNPEKYFIDNYKEEQMFLDMDIQDINKELKLLTK